MLMTVDHYEEEGGWVDKADLLDVPLGTEGE